LAFLDQSPGTGNRQNQVGFVAPSFARDTKRSTRAGFRQLCLRQAASQSWGSAFDIQQTAPEGESLVFGFGQFRRLDHLRNRVVQIGSSQH